MSLDRRSYPKQMAARSALLMPGCCAASEKWRVAAHPWHGCVFMFLALVMAQTTAISSVIRPAGDRENSRAGVVIHPADLVGLHELLDLRGKCIRVVDDNRDSPGRNSST